jgi:two-component system, OmpR family, response regulator MprA
MAANVLVIDDDPKITQLLRRALSLEGYAVRTAGSGSSGLEEARIRDPDLVILDILMPGMNGLEVCRELREFTRTPILLLTAKDEVQDRVEGLDSGADDYVVKPFALEELLARVRALLRRREGAEDGEQIQFSNLILDVAAHTVMRGEREISLSTTEFELLHYFISHPRRVLSREAILNAVWGSQFERPTNVVEVYVGYLRSKLEADGEARLIHTIRGAGYVLKEG